MVSCTSKTFQT